jgi:hypothetical protein
MAEKVAARPDGSTPDQAESWAECKAMYRLMDCGDVTHAEIIRPHCQQTKQCGGVDSVQLILCDTTEIDYGSDRHVVGLGPVGQGSGRGFYLHTGLMRDAATGAVIGIAGQELFYRKPKEAKKVHKNTKRRDPERESVVWGKLMDQIGAPPPGARWFHVCDRGADDYEVYCRAYLNRCGWVIRAARLNRKVLNAQGSELTLEEHLNSQVANARMTLDVPRQGSRSARTAEVTIRFAPIGMPRPRIATAWIREHAPVTPIQMWAVELIEENPPKGAQPLHWVLLTSQPVHAVEDALRVIGWYRQRWGVEEYHKALKTGCQVERRYYETAPRLERVTALLAVLAVRLLQIRSLAKTEPDRAAEDIVPSTWIQTLAKIRRKNAATMTIREFVRHLGGLGGHLGRKRDGEPGWITLWRGLEKLLLILRGVSLKQ